MTELVVTIDGPAASGKSTVARLLADRLGAAYLDTGAMYRAVTLAATRDAVELRDEQQLVDVIKRHTFGFEVVQQRMSVLMDGEDVTEAIRAPELTAEVRHIASAPRARDRLVEMQRAFAARHHRVVTEGRDQGTVAFPDADVKFYLTADAGERARRRTIELRTQGVVVDLQDIRQAIEARDKSDENRPVGPLEPARGALMIDTTHLRIAEVVDALYRHVEGQCLRNH